MDEVRTMEQGDSISQLDGADDPVSCNFCDKLFEGKNKGIKLTSHKINVHFKDHFRRVVKDETKRNGFYHCIEENCSAKQRQKADMFRHLATIHNYIKKFSNMTVGTCPLSVPTSMAPNCPNPGPKTISDLQSLAETEHTNQGIKLTGVFCIYVLTLRSSIQNLSQRQLCDVMRMVQCCLAPMTPPASSKFQHKCFMSIN